MKKTLFAAALMAMFIGGAKAQEKPTFKFYGFVRNYACYDTRESMTSISEQFYYMPKDISLDANGQDINAQPNMMLLSITTRLGVNVSGLKFLGSNTSAKIETDFAGFGTSNTVLRIRQAYAKMEWKHNHLLVGQAWHPIMGDMMPDVFSLETGAPFAPFSRSPQVRYDFVYKGMTLTATALYQFQQTSYGPDGASFNYARNAVPSFPSPHTRQDFETCPGFSHSKFSHFMDSYRSLPPLHSSPLPRCALLFPRLSPSVACSCRRLQLIPFVLSTGFFETLSTAVIRWMF